MEILINNVNIDFELQNEKKSGEILSALERELSENYQTICSFQIDDSGTNNSEFNELLNIPVSSIKRISIHTKPLSEMCLTAIDDLLTEFNISPPDKKKIESKLSYLISINPRVFGQLKDLIEKGFIREGQIFLTLLREVLLNPYEYLKDCANKLEILLPNLEEIPVFFQTGKDKEVVETIAVFSDLVLNLIRALGLLSSVAKGILPEKIGETSFKEFMEEFNSVLVDFTDAFSSGDTVLTGDIAEYEILPRAGDLIKSLKDIH